MDVLLLAAVLLPAVLLRVVGARSGLPLPLLNPDETNIVPRAWELVHGGGLDPGWYDYPSLVFLLVAPTQVALDEPSYGTARVVAVGLGLAGVVAAWWLGRVSAGRLAGLTCAAVVAVATTHVAYSRMAVTDVALTVGVTACLALIATGRLEWAGVVAGLAASAKYPGVLLLVPLVVAGLALRRRLARALALMVAAFLITSPFVALHADESWADFRRVQSLARDGWLGFEDDPATPLAFGLRLWETIGPVALVGFLGLGIAIRRRTRSDLVLLSFGVTYALSLLGSNAHFDRYLLPLLPVLAVLASRVPPLAVATLALAIVPLWWSVADARSLATRDRRVDAAAWIERFVPPDERLAADPSTLSLQGRPVTRLELPGPGRPFDVDRDLDRLRAGGVRWLVVGGAVTDRVLAAADAYPREARFYRGLTRLTPVYEVEGDEGRPSRPWLRVYRVYP
ncbi:MAG: DUF2029 domain-containing protein [Actinobacteria bacterium]|nr:DUF2029 domain-containing protein [Actinomycetota bacterium]